MIPLMQERSSGLQSQKCIDTIVEAIGPFRLKSSSDKGKRQYLQRIVERREKEAIAEIIEKHRSAITLPRFLMEAYHARRLPLLTSLPLSILNRILRLVFVPHPYHPLVLPREPGFGVETFEHITAVVSVLQTCKVIYQVGKVILYGENTFTTITPCTTYHLDWTLSRMPIWQQHLITSLSLQIDWADELWTKFPLIAVALHELKKIERLEIFIVSTTPPMTRNMLSHRRYIRELQEEQREKAKRYNRQGTAAEAMLTAEKKTLKDLVCTMRSLRVFRLVGFADEEFARRLELHVDLRGR